MSQTHPGFNAWLRTGSSNLASTIFRSPRCQSNQKLVVRSSRSRRRRSQLPAGMICRKPMLQASLNPTSPACRRVGECQNLLAARHGALRLLLLCRIAVSRLLVLLHDFLLILSITSCCLDCVRANLADHHLTAAGVGLRTVVRFARSVF